MSNRGGKGIMKILVVGGGGREHTLVWKLKKSPLVSEIYCAPGNGGIADIAYCVPIDAANIMELADFAQNIKIDLTVVGPELPLTMGIVDAFNKRGLKIFGPTKIAAQLEGSKVFAKEFTKKYNIPTAKFLVANSKEQAVETIKSGEFGYPVVIKADGLAGGKGSLVCEDEKSAMDAIKTIMEDRKFGMSGDRVVIEQFLEGQEATFKVITDSKIALPLASSQDHKRAYDNDQGPNTGGMGAFSPAVSLSSENSRRVMQEIIYPTIIGMRKEGMPYKGVIYAGLMITTEGPKLIEYNCRFGDPENQVVIPRLESDLVPILKASIDEELDKVEVKWKKEFAICVILASKGYPGSYNKGEVIEGLNDVKQDEHTLIFHAGTEKKDGKLVTSGGRVLGVTALAPSFPDAILKVYKTVELIKFNGMHYRKDIGRKTSASIFD
jgi:phosphoribosylamine--glycine ligase